MSPSTRRIAPFVLACLLCASAGAQDATYYMETFPNCEDNRIDPDRTTVGPFHGWFGDQHGSSASDHFSDDLQHMEYGSTDEPAPINSQSGQECGNFRGLGATGASYFSRAERWGIYLFTDEFMFSTDDLTALNVDVLSHARDSTPGVILFAMSSQVQFISTNRTHQLRPAFRMGDTWYISVPEDGASVPTAPDRTPGPFSEAWTPVEVSFDPNSLEYYAAPIPSTRGGCTLAETNCLPRLPDPLPLPTSLPSGVVDAFGFYMDKNWRGITEVDPTVTTKGFYYEQDPVVRIDNVEIRLADADLDGIPNSLDIPRVPVGSPGGLLLLAFGLVSGAFLILRRQ